jgi:glycosyltransferase A (GT-A) superfamily protein (DUF2064 family)
MTTLAVIAKECVPGKVKTRLHPDFTYEQAAVIAAACLDDTLAAVSDLPASRRILYFDGTVPPALAVRWEVVPQPSGTLDERIAHLFDLCNEPTLLIGMDTPHLDPTELRPLFSEWDADAWFGPAADGGFWALGLRHPDGSLVRGIPMSQATTGIEQERRLHQAGMRVRDLPTLTDVDTAGDLAQAAARAPRLAAVLGLVPA